MTKQQLSFSASLMGQDDDPLLAWAAQHNLQHVAGVDEAGRGPLAGPVHAAAVILDPKQPISGLNDSKKLSAKRRDALAEEIKNKAWAWAIASAEVEEIDQLNILQASKLAMLRAVEALSKNGQAAPCDGLGIDGNQRINSPILQITVVKGDARCAAIAAASILAKTARDALMLQLDQRYPGYGLAQHKGYGTAAHMDALQRLGATPIHRRSFAPVRRVLEQAEQAPA